MLPTLNLVGLDPKATREYVWVGDDAIDQEASDLTEWAKTGRGLVVVEGKEATTFRTRGLSPTVLEIVLNHARVGPVQEAQPEVAPINERVQRNWPAAERAAVAYGLISIENGPALKRVEDAGGWRVDDATLALLDGYRFAGTRLLSHLGNLIITDSRATDIERKP